MHIIIDDDEFETTSQDELKINKSIDARCCVCNERLTADNPHTCYACKKNMHGHIVCPMKQLICMDNDDNLYCSTKCMNERENI
jgi:hypothetical protein